MNNIYPVLLFTYNRYEHLMQVIDALLANKLSEETDLIIFSDGPKNKYDEIKVERVRAYLKGITGFKSVSIYESKMNKGLSRSLIEGITEVLKVNEAAIVLEDDIICSKYFLLYMNKYLNYYKEEDLVMHISGYNFPLEQPHELSEVFFYRGASCWGWGTWKRAWDHLILDGSSILNQILIENLEYEFNIQGSTDYIKMLKDQITGANDSWAVRWYGSIFLRKGLCLHPRISYVNNIGNDGSGIHSTKTKIFNHYSLNLNGFLEYYPDCIESKDAIKKINNFYNKNNKKNSLRKILCRIF